MNSFLKNLDRYFVELADKIALRDDIAQPGITYRQLDELSGRHRPGGHRLPASAPKQQNARRHDRRLEGRRELCCVRG